MIQPWETVAEEPEQDFRIFTVQERISVSPRTGQGHRIVVVRSSDWVNVIALTPRREVVLIEQYRHGIGQVTLEIPGGIVDPGESPLETGARELREETGYAGEDVALLGTVHPNPAFLTNRCHTVLVRNARKVADPELDSGEDIAVRLVPLAEISELVRAGQITHALVVVAFHWLALWSAEDLSRGGGLPTSSDWR